jgi:hypothetical protein
MLPTLKMGLKGTRFTNMEYKSNAMAKPRKIPKEDFRQCFQQWQDRWRERERERERECVHTRILQKNTNSMV